MSKPITRTAAFAYLRVSGRGQVTGHGYDRQAETIAAFSKSAGYEVKATYRDSHTGTESDRPAFLEMLTAILGNGVRVVIVESLDRLARDLMVQTRLIAELRQRGITLLSASTGQDVTADVAADPMREAMVQVQGVFAQLDKRLLVAKLAKARAAKRASAGRCEGIKPFGTLPGEAEILDRIVSLRRATRARPRMSFEKIAATLNEEGAPTRSGAKWAPATVYGIVKRVAPQLAGR